MSYHVTVIGMKMNLVSRVDMDDAVSKLAVRVVLPDKPLS